MMKFVHRPAVGLEGAGAQAVLQAYNNVIGKEPDGVEVDVRITADGVPIVAHWPIMRGAGTMPIIVSKLLYRRYPAGAFLRLRDLCEALSGYQGRLYVEIKDVSMEAVLRVVEDAKSFRGSLWFIALPWRRRVLGFVKRRLPSAKVNFIILNPVGAYAKVYDGIHPDAITLGWRGVNTFRLLSSVSPKVWSSAEKARRAGLEICAGLATSQKDIDWINAFQFHAVWVDPPLLATTYD